MGHVYVNLRSIISFFTFFLNQGGDELVHSDSIYYIVSPEADKQQTELSQSDLFLLKYTGVLNCNYQSKKEGKDQESIQSSTTPDPG